MRYVYTKREREGESERERERERERQTETETERQIYQETVILWAVDVRFIVIPANTTPLQQRPWDISCSSKKILFRKLKHITWCAVWARRHSFHTAAVCTCRSTSIYRMYKNWLCTWSAWCKRRSLEVRCKYDEHVLWSCQLAQARKFSRGFSRHGAPRPRPLSWTFFQKISLPFSCVLTVPDRSHGFLLKLQWKKFGRTATSKAKPPGSPTGVETVAQTVRRRSTSPHGKEKDLDRRNRRLPPGEEVTRSWAFMSYHSKTAYEFVARRSSPQNKVSQWGFLWVERSIGRRGSWADHSEATKLSAWAEHRDEATKLSAASRSEATKLSRATGAKRQSWAERECPSNAGLDSWCYIYYCPLGRRPRGSTGDYCPLGRRPRGSTGDYCPLGRRPRGSTGD